MCGIIGIASKKAVSSNIIHSLKKFDTRNDYYWMHVHMNGATEKSPKLQIDKAHMSLPIFKRLYPKDFELLNEYTVFAFSRNPIKRIISSFYEPRKGFFRAFNENCTCLTTGLDRMDPKVIFPNIYDEGFDQKTKEYLEDF